MNAQNLFESYIKSIKDDKHVYEHTKRVVSLCEKFADKHPNTIDRVLLLDAAWLHDIAKYRAGEKHNEPQEVRAVIEECQECGEEENLDTIVEIIANHKGDFAPKQNALECAVLRISDKLDKFEKGKKDAEAKCKKSIRKIQESKRLSDSEFQDLQSFYQNELQLRK